MRDIIVIGASAGGVETLIKIIQLLPADLRAAVFIVLHTPSDAPGLLPVILSRHGYLPAVHPVDDQTVELSTIYAAPPDQHMLFSDDKIILSRGPKENMLRPSIDTLFRSAADNFGDRVVGVVLSGTRNDGAAGMLAIKDHGGVTIVQDPGEATFSGMPESVLSAMEVNYILPVAEIASVLTSLALGKEEEKKMTKYPDNTEVALQGDRDRFMRGSDANLPRTLLTCPECGGVLWEAHEENITRYSCQIGHVFSEDSLLTGQSAVLEEVLWSAVRALEEQAAISARLASRVEKNGSLASAERFLRRAKEAHNNAAFIRQIVINGSVTDFIGSEQSAD